MHMMAQFMSEHNLDLIRSIFIQHCVAQHNTPGVAQAHQCSIGGSRFTTQLHGEDAAHASMSAVRQRQQPLLQFAFGQWNKFVEERENEHRCKISHDDCEKEEYQCNP